MLWLGRWLKVAIDNQLSEGGIVTAGPLAEARRGLSLAETLQIYCSIVIGRLWAGLAESFCLGDCIFSTLPTPHNSPPPCEGVCGVDGFGP